MITITFLSKEPGAIQADPDPRIIAGRGARKQLLLI